MSCTERSVDWQSNAWRFEIRTSTYAQVYKFDDSQQSETSTSAYFSFGGLLMALKGSYRHLSNVVVGENVYLLIRK